MEGYDSEKLSLLPIENPNLPLDSSLIFSLPEELIVQISLEACKPVYECETSVKAVQLVTPSFLGRICKQWRRIAMSTQELWGFILITISQPHKLKNQAQVWHFKTCLDRSGKYPVFVQFESSGYGSRIEPHLLDEVCDLLQVCSDRLRHFSSLGVPNLADALGELYFPALSSMAFGDYADWWWCLAKDAPVRDLSLTNLPLSTDDLNWDRLNGLSLNGCSWAMCLSDLNLARNLVHCHLLNLKPFLNEINDDNPVAQFPHLLTLIMSNSLATMIFSVLDRMKTPVLKKLGVQWEEAASGPLVSVANLVTRSSCSLDELSITVRSIDVPVVIGCLECIPNLTKLGLYLSDVCANDVIDHLCYTRPHTTPQILTKDRLSFPNLHQVTDELPILFHYKALFDMIDERRAAPPLRKRTVSTPRVQVARPMVVRLIFMMIHIDVSVLETMERYGELLADGLTITIS